MITAIELLSLVWARMITADQDSPAWSHTCDKCGKMGTLFKSVLDEMDGGIPLRICGVCFNRYVFMGDKIYRPMADTESDGNDQFQAEKDDAHELQEQWKDGDPSDYPRDSSKEDNERWLKSYTGD